MKAIVPQGMIEQRILLIRGHKVMLDSDLAELYGVATKMLIRAVKRNKERFPTTHGSSRKTEKKHRLPFNSLIFQNLYRQKYPLTKCIPYTILIVGDTRRKREADAAILF